MCSCFRLTESVDGSQHIGGRPGQTWGSTPQMNTDLMTDVNFTASSGFRCMPKRNKVLKSVSPVTWFVLFLKTYTFFQDDKVNNKHKRVMRRQGNE